LASNIITVIATSHCISSINNSIIKATTNQSINPV
jgi:hypothetical protein